MEISFEVLNRMVSAEVEPMADGEVLQLPQGGMVLDTATGIGLPNRKILYRAKGVSVALRLHTMTAPPAGATSLVVLYEFE